MTTSTENLQIIKELQEKGIVPGEEMERQVQDVGGEVIHRGDEDTPTPMVTIATEGPGYTTVYHTETGLDSQVSNNMMPAQLKKKLPSGKRAFTIYDPGFRPVEGVLMCYLHSEHAMRKVCDEFGFPTCVKTNLASPFDVEMHMRHRHTQEWLALEHRRERLEREETRDIARGTLEAIQAQGQSNMPEAMAAAVQEVQSHDSQPMRSAPAGVEPDAAAPAAPRTRPSRRKRTPEQIQAANERRAKRTPEEVQAAKDKMARIRGAKN